VRGVNGRSFRSGATTTRLKFWTLGVLSAARYARVIKVRDERANTRMQLTTAAVTPPAGARGAPARGGQRTRPQLMRRR